mgnify:CR=1 FL=1
MSCLQCSPPTSCLIGGWCVATHMLHAYCQPSLHSSWAAAKHSLQEQLGAMRGRKCTCCYCLQQNLCT